LPRFFGRVDIHLVQRFFQGLHHGRHVAHQLAVVHGLLQRGPQGAVELYDGGHAIACVQPVAHEIADILLFELYEADMAQLRGEVQTHEALVGDPRSWGLYAAVQCSPAMS
jgi:hypothetical protein